MITDNSLWWMRDRPINKWDFNKPLMDDIALSLNRYARKFGKPAARVVVFENEYAGEEIDGVVLETTAQRANRGVVVVA